MLAPDWFPLLRKAMIRSGAVLIAPEDTGLGNMLRAEYHDMPESSFMFFDTARALACRTVRLSTTWLLNIYRRFRFVHPFRRLNLYTTHLTHQLPEILRTHGQHWLMMRPLPSRRLATPWFTPEVRPGERWNLDRSVYDYGFGNFYLFEGVITHYHNWLARFLGSSIGDTHDPAEIRRLKQQFAEAATQRFLRDYDAGELHLPDLQ